MRNSGTAKLHNAASAT